MATLFDATADKYTRTTSLPPIGTFSILCWSQLAIDRNGVVTFAYLGSSTVITSAYAMGTSSTGTALQLRGSGNATGSDLVLGTWYHTALVVAGTGTNQCQLFLDGTLALQVNGNSSAVAQTLQFGNNINSEFLNGRLAAVKIYDVALSAADIQQEMRCYMPMRMANLNAFYPMAQANVPDNIRDYSGLNRGLTVAGTVVYADGPPIPWSVAPVTPLGRAPGAPPVVHTSLPPPHRPWRIWRRAA